MKEIEGRCRRIRREFVAYLDGELPAPRGEAVARHVRVCTGCQLEMKALARVGEALIRLPRPRVEEASQRLVLARVEGAIGAGGTGWPAWWRIPVLVSALGAAMIFLWQVRTTTAPRPLEVGGAKPPPVRTVSEAEDFGGLARRSGMEVAAKAKARVKREARAQGADRERVEDRLAHPPRPLYEKPDLFLDFPIVLDLEKLEDFEAIMEAHPAGGKNPKPSGQSGRG